MGAMSHGCPSKSRRARLEARLRARAGEAEALTAPATSAFFYSSIARNDVHSLSLIMRVFATQVDQFHLDAVSSMSGSLAGKATSSAYPSSFLDGPPWPWPHVDEWDP